MNIEQGMLKDGAPKARSFFRADIWRKAPPSFDIPGEGGSFVFTSFSV
jgi:hypothetical protein